MENLYPKLKTTISEEEFNILNGSELMPLICWQCANIYYSKKTNVVSRYKKENYLHKNCSNKCKFAAQKLSIETTCGFCAVIVTTLPKTILESKSGKVFCGRSCAAKYNNTHKTKGYRRSKIEVYLENQIKNHYPTLKMIPNDISTINYELDFYFPELKFAIEFNGILHYEPIYGLDKLKRIKFNDKQKILLCYEKGIELCVLDIAHIKHLTEKKKIEVWDRINSILESIAKRELS